MCGARATRSFHGHGVGVDVVALDEAVARGTYRVESWQRPCDGNCEHLDAPTDRCSATVAVEAAQHRRVAITFSPGSRCTIVVG